MPAHIWMTVCMCVCVIAYKYIKALELRAMARTAVWEPEVRLSLNLTEYWDGHLFPRPWKCKKSVCTAGCPSGLAESPEACPRR